MVSRSIPPPDFRYVGLAPGLSPLHMAAVAAGASTGLAGSLLVMSGTDTTSLLISAVAGGLTALTMGRRGAFRFLRGRPARAVAMAIVPWGVLIRPDEEGDVRVLRWSGVRAVSVDCIHTRDVSGSPQTTWSFVTIETTRERFLGRTLGHAPLERLMAHLDAYAHESSRAVALDLTGNERAEATLEPVIRTLLGRARSLLTTAAGVDALGLHGDGYRELSTRRPTSETIETLRGVLREDPGMDADRRVLAALLAGELGVRELGAELLRLVTTAHPLVAAAAKAAALRLGVEVSKTGSLDEVAPFVIEDDLLTLRGWAEGPSKALPERESSR